MEIKNYREKFKKVRGGDFNVRYIDAAGKWWKAAFNGKFTKSRAMKIDREYGITELNISVDDIYGLRVSD